MALDWDNIIVEDDENSQVQDTPVTIMASGTPGSPISWDKLIIEEEETTVEGEDESVLIFASGVPGHSATIDGVTAETLPEGSEATVENIGTSDNARFHFGIPKGDQGERGEPGDQGERGEKGDPGIAGAEYDAENERVIFYPTDADVYTKDETDEMLLAKAPVILNSASGSIASFTDGSPSPVTALSVSIEPVQDLHGYDNPWPAGGGKNLIPYPYTSPDGVYSGVTITTQADGRIVSSGSSNNSLYFTLADAITLSAGTYTLSLIGTFQYAQIRVRANGENIITINNTAGASSFTLESETVVSIDIVRLGTNISFNIYVQLESGSTATSYAPYSNICPISGHTSATVTRTGINIWDEEWEVGIYNAGNGTKNNSVTTRIRTKNPISVLPETTYYKVCPSDGFRYLVFYDRNMTFLSTLNPGAGNQSFTTPAKAYFMNTYTEVDTYGTTYKNDMSINYPSTDHAYHKGYVQTVTIDLDGTRYGGKLNVPTGTMTVDRVAVLFKDLKNTSGTASANWSYDATNSAFSTANTIIPSGSADADTGIITSCYASRPYGYNGSYSGENSVIWAHTSGSLRVKDNRYTDVDAWKSAIANETIVYPLATPLTVQLTPAQLSTLLGENHIWSGTGDTEATYRADTKLYIQKLTKPTEDDMIANNNIAANTFFMVGNNLYFATSAIATGTTIVPGSNCTALSLADALNNLNA